MSMAQLTEYAGQDADATLRLGIKFEAQLREQHMWHLMEGKPYADMPVLKCLYEMELFGAPLSQEKMQEMRELIHEKLASLYSSMAESLGRDFNPKSSPQMQKILFEDLGFPPTSILTATGAPSTDKNALDELMLMVDHAFPKTLRLHRQYSTTLSTFIEGAEKRSSKSRLHPNFLSARTVSGRIVCVNPNLANIQRDKEFEEGLRLSVRGIYVARPGWVIVYGDWSQIEFKCAALIAGDQKLIHALFNEGADFHTLTAEGIRA
jgi:DNA polymerase-1